MPKGRRREAIDTSSLSAQAGVAVSEGGRGHSGGRGDVGSAACGQRSGLCCTSGVSASVSGSLTEGGAEKGRNARYFHLKRC